MPEKFEPSTQKTEDSATQENELSKKTKKGNGNFLEEELKARERLIPVVEEIAKQLGKEFHKIPEYFVYDLGSQLHEFRFNNRVYKWSDEEFERLKKDIEEFRREGSDINVKGWDMLKSANIRGLPIIEPISNPLRKGSTRILKIGDLEFAFSSENLESLSDAYKWALENGAVRIEEIKIREAVKNGANINNIPGEVIDSPDHMRKITTRFYTIGGIQIKPDGYLYKLASRLIEERDKAKQELETENMKVRVRIYKADSRTKGEIIAEVEGQISQAFEEALKKVDPFGNPRRHYSVTITRLFDDGKEGKKEREEFGLGRDVIKYLKEFNKKKLL